MFNLVPFNDGRRGLASLPFGEFYDLLDGFLADGFLPRNGRGAVDGAFKIDVSETETAYEIKAELPGVKKGELSLDLSDDGQLTIAVRKEDGVEDTTRNYIHRERRVSSMSRSLRLHDVDESGIKARLEDGVLTVEIAKAAKKDKTTRIEIE